MTEMSVTLVELAKNTYPKLIAIGASTGGPKAIQTVLEGIPKDITSFIFIVQHMPENFTKSFAVRLGQVTGLNVSESTDQEIAIPGHVYVAKGGSHLLIRESTAGLRLYHSPDPANTLHRPSIDVFLNSFASLNGSKRAVILTGMGADGAKGLHEVRVKGGITAVENEKDCVVYGMPKAAYELDPAHQVLPLNSIGGFLAGF